MKRDLVSDTGFCRDIDGYMDIHFACAAQKTLFVSFRKVKHAGGVEPYTSLPLSGVNLMASVDHRSFGNENVR